MADAAVAIWFSGRTPARLPEQSALGLATAVCVGRFNVYLLCYEDIDNVPAGVVTGAAEPYLPFQTVQKLLSEGREKHKGIFGFLSSFLCLRVNVGRGITPTSTSDFSCLPYAFLFKIGITGWKFGNVWIYVVFSLPTRVPHRRTRGLHPYQSHGGLRRPLLVHRRG